jgi:DNA repair exonuclease SbcCD ATPase subunit
MILNTLRASNVLKYARLELNEIPTNAQIAVSGPNESGKTAVVETICFALFGRTFSQGPEALQKIIRWGETSCRAELGFSTNDDHSYRLVRSLDREGVHAAELYRNEETEPFASGPNTVRDHIVKLCGFDYPQYLDALYLAQMEISAPHSQSDTIKEIAGTTELEDVADELREEIAQEQAKIAQLEAEATDFHRQIGALNIHDSTIPGIETEKARVQKEIDGHRQDTEALGQATRAVQATAARLQETLKRLSELRRETSLGQWQDFGSQLAAEAQTIHDACAAAQMEHELCADPEATEYLTDLKGRVEAFAPVRERVGLYRDKLAAMLEDTRGGINSYPKQLSALRARLTRVRSLHGVMGLLFLICALAALGAWAGWWVAKPPADSSYVGWAGSWLEQHIPGWDAAYLGWMQPAAIALTVLAAVFLMWPMALKPRISQLRGELEQVNGRLRETQARVALLDRIDEPAYPEASQALHKLGDKEITGALKAFEEGAGVVFVEEESLADYRSQLTELLQESASGIGGDLREGLATRIGALRQSIQDKEQRHEELDREIATEHERRQKAEELGAYVEATRPKIEALQQGIRVRETGLKLVTDTSRTVYARFNTVLSRYTGDVMPKLTEGRYRQMQIDDQLRLRVFSAEKNDFADLDEFSSGTQRQTMLALRLAMAKALVEATEQERQFIILDEPFAFFDRERIRNTLKALPSMEKHISQIWIISQEFESYEPFTLHVACTRETDELIVGQAKERVKSVH